MVEVRRLTQPHGEGTPHGEELVTGSADGDRGEAGHHAGRVPGGAGQDGAAQQADGGHHGADDSAVREPGQLLGAQARAVGDGPRHHAATNHGSNGDSHGQQPPPAHQVHHCRGPEGCDRGPSSGSD